MTARFRWSRIDGAELRCLHCDEWWSVGDDIAEFWVIGKWSECRACVRERGRVYQAMRSLDPAFVEKRRLRVRRYKAEFHRTYPELAREYDRVMARNKRARARERSQAARDAMKAAA